MGVSDSAESLSKSTDSQERDSANKQGCSKLPTPFLAQLGDPDMENHPYWVPELLWQRKEKCEMPLRKRALNTIALSEERINERETTEGNFYFL